MSKRFPNVKIVDEFDLPFKEWIMGVETWQAGERTTVCLVTLDNGTEIVGYSHCMDPEDYDFEIGKREAFKNACDKIYPIYAFIINECNCMDEEDEEDEDDEFICDDCKSKCCHK